MSRHATVEEISAYLDEELEAGAVREVEEHLAECAGCQVEVDRIRRVVRRLGALERQGPPPVLAFEVQRRIALYRDRATARERLQERLARLTIQPSVAVTFAVTLALASIIVLLADAVDRSRSQPTRVYLHQAPEPKASEEAGMRPERIEVAGRLFERTPTGWRERGVREPAGLALTPGSPAWAELLADHPDLAALTGLEGRVVVRVGKEVVELRLGAGQEEELNGTERSRSP